MPRGAVDLTKYLTKVGTSPMAEGGFSDIWQGRLDARAPIPTSMYHTGYPFERTSAFSAAPLKVAIKQLRGVRIKDDDKSKRLFIVSILSRQLDVCYSRDFIDKRMKRELNIWAQLRDNCFVPLLGYSFYGTMPCLISPWYEFGNVLQYMQQRPDASKPDLILDVIEGLYYLHHLNWPPITHGDIKAANVLVDQDGNARISDFGLSKVLQDGSSGYTTSSATAGTSRWMAPELFQEHGERCQETDIYALSLTVVEIYTNGTPPFPHLNDIKFLGYISTSNTPHRSHYPDLQLSEPIWKVLEAGWQLDAQKRPTAHDFQEGYLIGLWS
ncbi:hypothetical protein FRC03_009854 [Tulasnella sp. 419]|nr:hypothetical protein FRC03_009854 [Tulasnella sp. 419]